MIGARQLGFLFLVVAMAVSASWAAAQPWTVTLNKKQARDFADMQTKPRHTALAVSPDGAWGVTYGKRDAKTAERFAMQYCRGFLKPGRRDCVIYSVNGKVVAPAQVTVPKVSKVYSPVDGKGAAAFFGLRAVQYNGRPSDARAVLKQAGNDVRQLARRPKDTALERAFSGASFAQATRGGTVIWFGPREVETFVAANKQILKIFWSDWFTTQDGLVCLTGGRWASTGKGAPDNCLIIERIENGNLTYAWMETPGKRQKGYVVAGDARFGAAR